MKKIIIGIIILVTFAAPLPVGAALVPHERAEASLSPLDESRAHAIVVIDAGSGIELLSKRADEEWPLASLTKLLAAATLLQGKPNLKKTITMQRSDEVGGARLRNVRVGTRFRASDLLAASLIGSANNATQALARTYGPGAGVFLKRMNATAARLKLVHTRVYDPTGLNARNVSTAREIANMLIHARKYPEVRTMQAAVSYAVNPVGRGAKHTIKNTNKLLGTDLPYTIAGKTGYIEESGYNFTAIAKDASGHEIAIVLLGNTGNAANFADTKRLADWVFLNFEWEEQ